MKNAKQITDDFPFKCELNLSKLIEFWESMLNAADPHLVTIAETVLRPVDDLDFLRKPITDLSVLDDHRHVLNLMLSALFPPAQCDRVPMAVGVPFTNDLFYASNAFKELDLFGNKKPLADEKMSFNILNLQNDMIRLGRIMFSYHWILREVYNLDAPFGFPVVIPSIDPVTGLEKYFQADFDDRFTSVRIVGKKPSLSHDQYETLIDNPFDLELWKKTLPPKHFVFSGFIPISAIDITRQEVVSQLKNDLLQTQNVTSGDFVYSAQARMRTLLGSPELELGIIGLGYSHHNDVKKAHAVGRSLLFAPESPDCPNRSRSIYDKAVRLREPMVIKDLARVEQPTQFEKYLLKQGHRSVVLIPLIDENDPIGILELATPNAGELNTMKVIDLVDVIMLFTVALKQGLDKAQDRVQTVIKEQYTAIHPEVEWRFREAAATFIEKQELGADATVEPIVFRNVYPLYGLTDIRNSSIVRTAAIQEDMSTHLKLADDILSAALTIKPMPALEEVRYRLRGHLQNISQDFTTGSEVGILDFVRSDIAPLFDTLREFGPSVERAIDRYNEAMDPALGLVYQRRKDFEESLTRITQTISGMIDEKQIEAQKMFPHFFEKYKTDGVDYNMYVGQSLVEDRSFNALHLHNLRIWQLMLTCSIDWELRKVLPTLPIAMESTHLILVHDSTLDIRYRLDEKRFDVDGAYNIRYEIIKKRIDKALVRGTDERLTQPGKLSIVYSQEKEMQEYERYIHYLQSLGYLENDLELLELTDYQGARGLLAMRVGITKRTENLAGDSIPSQTASDEPTLLVTEN